MNKKVLLSLLLVPLLAGCSNSYSTKKYTEINEYVMNFESSADLTNCIAESKGKFFDTDVDVYKDYNNRLTRFGAELDDYQRDENGDLIYEDNTESGNPKLKDITFENRCYGNSLHLLAPLVIDKNNFITYNEFGLLSNGCMFKEIKDLIVDKDGSNAVFQTEFLEDGGIKFFAESSNLYFTFYNIDIFEQGIEAGARWDISLTYNNQGCLTEEYIATHKQSDPYNRAEVKATYIYA